MSDSKVVKKTIHMAMTAGRIMLESSAETYRVEDTIMRLCSVNRCVDYVDVFVIPTGIFLTIGYGDDAMTYIKRTKLQAIDLNKINLVNDFSRSFINSNMSIDDAMVILEEIDKSEPYSNIVRSLFGGFAGGFSALLFGGLLSDFIWAFVISMAVVYINYVFLDRVSLIGFVKQFIVSAIGTIFSLLVIKFNLAANLDMIITGFIMPLVPGFMITNATRDTISGDFLAGLSRGSEAVMSALSIASGVGIVLNYYYAYIL